MNDVVVFKDDGLQLKVGFDGETVWLRQSEIAQLFEKDRTVITRHINNILKDKEVDEKSNVQKMHIANSDKPVKFYSLDIVLAVGYRTNSAKAIKFRQWVTKILKSYMIQGYVLDRERLQKQKLAELEATLKLIREAVASRELGADEARGFVEIIGTYAKSWALLQGYDEQTLEEVVHTREQKFILDYDEAKAAISEGVEDIFSLAGLEKPNIGILSDEFLEDVAHMQYKNLAVTLLERLLKDEIKAKTRTNVVQEKKFSERLQATLAKYHNRAIETAQVIEELIAMAKEFAKANKHGEELGLSFDELAFYDALAENESALREMGDEILKKIAQELTEKLRKSVSVDWQKRESVRAKMRNMIRIILRRYKYPPDKQPEAIKLVMQQAEALSEEWSREKFPDNKNIYIVNNTNIRLQKVAEPNNNKYGGKG
ncbi:MAG: hypothetical protein B6D59_05775 [Campylobacteraceae bacterium 4484_4]|nr:MAG: hypothetical protein B6D59_05775 [Campylobacteraceae bacterium 4484_4]